MEYVDLQVRIGPRVGENAYAVTVNAPVVGEARAVFVPPLTDEQLELFVLKVGLARRGVRRIHSSEWRAAQDFGQKLFRALFTDEIRAAYLSGHNDAVRHGKGLRVKLALDAPELANYPWEFLYDPSANQFLALFEDTPILRYVELARPVLPLTVSPPLRMLALASSPQDYPPLDLAKERRNLARALQQLIDAGLVELDWLPAATLEALREQLLKRAYHIFHFFGHGGFDAANQDGVLIFEHPNQYAHRVSGERLAVILGNHRTLRLAALNACEGARTSEQDPFAGAAMTLVQTGNLPAVIAMQFEISDDAAIDFASGFYAALATGRPVDAAVSQGRQAIFASGNDVEWSAPVLYLRAADGIIFNVDLDRALTQVEKLESQTKTESAEPEKTKSELMPGQSAIENRAPAPTMPQPRAENVAPSRSAETAHAQKALVATPEPSSAAHMPPRAAPAMIQSMGALYGLSVGIWTFATVLPRFLNAVPLSLTALFISILTASAGMYLLFRLSRFSPAPSTAIGIGLGYAAAVVIVLFFSGFLGQTYTSIAETVFAPLLASQPDDLVYLIKDIFVHALFGAMIGLLGGAAMVWQMRRAATP